MKQEFKINSAYGQITVEDDAYGSVCLTQNEHTIRITPAEIPKLAGCLFAFRKENHPQLASQKQNKQPQTSDSYMSKQKEQHDNAYKPWTTEEETRLKELWSMGLSPKEIGDKLGRNEGSITSRLKKIKL